ncbi:MAG: hypothetical protein RSG59_08245 [Ruthenibacterium sp.]
MGSVWRFLFENREAITFFLALAGFVMSAGNSAFLIYKNRRRVKVLWKSVSVAEHLPKHPVMLEAIIENHSAQPIALSRIFLVLDRCRYEFEWIPQVCFTSSYRIGKEILNQQVMLSMQLPISLAGIAATGGFLYVNTDDDLTIEMLKIGDAQIEFCTSKGTFSTKLPLAVFDVNHCADNAQDYCTN